MTASKQEKFPARSSTSTLPTEPQTAPAERENHAVATGKSLEQNRIRHDLQARQDRGEELAPPRWSKPLVETHLRCNVYQRNGGCHVARSSLCCLISSITALGTSRCSKVHSLSGTY